MSTSFEVRDVINFLRQRYITTSSDWVEACITFVKQEHAGQNLSIHVLKDYVYQQWLTADLEEMGVSALPNELPTTQKITLNGSFALQVNSIRDVGKPAYAQLKELERHTSSNAEFSSAPEASVPPWEAKPTRMLMLNLTDGCTSVQGMEYKPISFLSQALPPGVKVLIQGPVDSRFGVFLLTPEKIQVLGGEVESKLEQFAQKTVLREILQLPTTEDNVSELNNPNGNDEVQFNDDTQDLNSISIISGSNNSRLQNSTSSSVFRQQNTNVRNASSRAELNTRQNNTGSRNTLERQNRGASNSLENYFNLQNQGERQNINTEDNLDAFEDEDDDFAQSLDYEAIDELEKEISATQSESFEDIAETEDVWNEDEDVLQDMMAFQDENPVFELPRERPDVSHSSNRTERESGVQRNAPFTYLSSVLAEQLPDCLVTIKGFIIRVLSKLECTVDKGWNLCVKINDGTATLDANIHDKVLEGIIGVSAVEMVKMQKQAAQDEEKRKEVNEAISKCRVTLQDYNCLMDVRFSPGSKPCIMKCHPVTQLHIKQLLERTRSHC